MKEIGQYSHLNPDDVYNDDFLLRNTGNAAGIPGEIIISLPSESGKHMKTVSEALADERALPTLRSLASNNKVYTSQFDAGHLRFYVADTLESIIAPNPAQLIPVIASSELATVVQPTTMRSRLQSLRTRIGTTAVLAAAAFANVINRLP